MIRVNLLGTERARVKTRAGFTEAQKVTVGCGLIMLLAAGYIGYRFWSIRQDGARIERELADTEREALRLRNVLTEVQRFEAQRAALGQRVNLIEELRRGQTGPVHMLDEISRSLPDMLWLTDLTQKEDVVTIEGRASTLSALSDFALNLQNSQYFRRPVDVSSTTETDPQGDLVRFVIRATFVAAGNAQSAPPAGAAPPGVPPPPTGRGRT